MPLAKIVKDGSCVQDRGRMTDEAKYWHLEFCECHFDQIEVRIDAGRADLKNLHTPCAVCPGSGGAAPVQSFWDSGKEGLNRGDVGSLTLHLFPDRGVRGG